MSGRGCYDGALRSVKPAVTADSREPARRAEEPAFPPEAASATRAPWRALPALITVVVGLSLTALATRFARARERTELERDFERLAQGRAGAFERDIHLRLDKLATAREFLETQGEPGPAAFSQVARRLLAHDPWLQALAWAPRVSDAERSTRAAEPGDPPIFDCAPSGELIPARTRAEYFPIVYCEPAESHPDAVGFDIASDPGWAASLASALHSEHPFAATSRRELVPGRSHAGGVLVVLPCSVGARGTSAPGRRDAPGAYLIAMIRVGDLLELTTGYFPETGIDIAITDGLAPEGERLIGLHRSPDRDPGDALPPVEAWGAAGDLAHRTPIDIGGRTWTVSCRPTSRYYETSASSLSLVVLASGLISTLLATGLISIRAARRRAVNELAASEERYRVLVENAPEAIVVLDVRHGRFVDANENACRLFKTDRATLRRMGPAELSPPQQPDGRTSKEAASDFIGRASTAGEKPSFEWLHRDTEGNEIPCEIRLARFESSRGRLLRGSITDISERKRAERRQSLMMQELDHRVKNNLAAVLAITDQTLETSRSISEFRESFGGRIRALARTHEALAGSGWEGIAMDELVRLNLDAFRQAGEDRVQIEGAPFMLPAYASSPMCMALHELATNATKYGALSTPQGRVHVSWIEDEERLHLTWTESDGPPVAAPAHRGFGTSLIRGVAEYELGGAVAFDFRASGMVCRLSFPWGRPPGDRTSQEA